MEAADKTQNSKVLEILRRYGISILFVAPYILIFTFFTAVPLVMGVGIAFMNYDPYNLAASSFVGFKNFIYIFNPNSIISQMFWPAFGTTVLFALVAVPFLILVPLLLAILIDSRPPGYKIFRAIIYLPSVVSVTVLGIIFSSIFAGNESGLANALLGTSIQWLNKGINRWIIILLVSIWWQTGTNFVIIGAGLRDVPRSLYEACEMDGGNAFVRFIKVTLPNIKGQLSLCLFTTIIGYLGLYGQPSVLFGNDNAPNALSPDTPMIMIQQWLNDTSFSKRTGALSAVAVVFGILTMVISLTQKAAGKERKGGHSNEETFFEYGAFQKREEL